MINIEKLEFEEFKKFDYILYDQSLFRKLLGVYKENQIKYKILAINVFKDRESAPILIDIKSMNSEVLEDYYENIFLKEYSNSLSYFNCINLVSNIIKSKLDIDDMAEALTKLLKYDSKTIIRFYDPRVNIHLINISQYNILDLNMRKWINKFNMVYDEWYVGIFGTIFKFNKKNLDNKFVDFSLIDIDRLNNRLKKKKFKNFDELIAFIQSSYNILEKGV